MKEESLKPKRATFRVRHEYRPVAELLHGSWSLRDSARRDPIGAHWKCMGSLVLLAFSLEAFCQRVGPDLFKADWLKGKKVEGLGLKRKLTAIGENVGVDVDFNVAPWQGIARLYAARSGLAHAKTGIRELVDTMNYASDVDPHEVAKALAAAQWEPLINEDALDEVDQDVRSGLTMLATACGIEFPFDSGIRSMHVQAED